MERTYDDFDKYASAYREIHNQNIKISGADSDYFAKMKVLEVKKYEGDKPLRILDLGCGDGKSGEFFSKLFPSCEYIGIDISEKSIAEAAQKKLTGCDFRTYDGKRIPFDEESFDVAYIACVFHHIEFKLHAGLLQEIRRVLKKGGRVHLFEHNPYNPVTQKVVRECPFDEDAVLLSPAYSKSLFKAGGMEFKINYLIFFPRYAVFRVFLWMENFLKFIPLGAQYHVRATK